MAFSSQAEHRHARRPTAAAVLALIAAVAGCSGHMQRAASLPKELYGPPVVNPQALNLSALGDFAESVQEIQRGDVLEVTLVTDYVELKTTTAPMRVAEDGGVAVPLIGAVRVAGMTLEEAEQAIAAEGVGRGVFRAPCVTVTMKQARTNRITVVGAVNRPGVHELPRGSSSLLSALVAAEGLGKEAGGEVEIRRGASSATNLARRGNGPGRGGVALASDSQPAAETIRVDLRSAAEEGPRRWALDDGDVVYVAKRMLKPVYVLGLVHKPGEYEYPRDKEIRVLDALALAGGCSSNVAEKLLVIRHLPGKTEPVAIAASIGEAKRGPDNIPLAPGDTVIVEQTPATVVVDVLQNFFRFGFSGAVPIF